MINAMIERQTVFSHNGVARGLGFRKPSLAGAACSVSPSAKQHPARFINSSRRLISSPPRFSCNSEAKLSFHIRANAAGMPVFEIGLNDLERQMQRFL
jgi:hypothetical protein